VCFFVISARFGVMLVLLAVSEDPISDKRKCFISQAKVAALIKLSGLLLNRIASNIDTELADLGFSQGGGGISPLPLLSLSFLFPSSFLSFFLFFFFFFPLFLPLEVGPFESS